MAVVTYRVKRGDTLWGICSSKDYGPKISGSTIQAKINTLVKLNNIKNPDLIIVGQVLKLSDDGSGSTSGSGSSASSSTSPTSPTIKLFGLQASAKEQGADGRAMYVTWTWNRPHTSKYKVRWRYYANGIWTVGDESETTSYEDIYCQSSWTAPTDSSKVRFSVKAISATYKDSNNNEIAYFTDATWSTETEYDFSNNPPSVPSTPNVKIEDLKLTASIDNIDAKKINATTIEFEIIKNNTSKINTTDKPTAIINTTSNYVSYSCSVPAGGEYKVRCRAVRGSLTSGWSDFSSSVGTKPIAPSGITTLMAKRYSESEISVYLEWSEVTTADTYDIEYTTNKAYFDGSDQTYTKTGIEFTHFELTGLELGHEYFFRVRAVNQNGESDWTEIQSLVIGKKPAAPTTWSSTTTAIVGEPLNLYWVHNAEDGSSETYAEVYLNIDGIEETHTIKNTDDEETKDKTKVYSVDTSVYSEGVKIEWKVRTAGVTKEYGDWSIQRTIDVYARPTLELGVTDKDGEMITTLTEFPFYIKGLAGPKTQTPIGYYVKITANEYYQTVDDMGRTKTVNKGDQVYSKYFDTSDNLLLEMSANNIDLESGITYAITCSVTMDSGLSTEITYEFTVSWNDVAYNLNVDVLIDEDTLTATIRPYSVDENGDLIEGLTLAVYRREFDGSFTELGKGITNSNNTSITDPHPALDYARYRIVAKDKSTGAVSFYDAPGYPVGGKSVIIQWDEDWSTFDVNDEYSVEKPSWSGSMLKLPYNIDNSEKTSIDATLVEYAGRKHPVSYYGTQLGETASWSVDVPKEDKDTIYALRRLAKWIGDVYVREPSGTGYWANISVSFGQTHRDLTIPVSLDIKRVEGGA